MIPLLTQFVGSFDPPSQVTALLGGGLNTGRHVSYWTRSNIAASGIPTDSGGFGCASNTAADTACYIYQNVILPTRVIGLRLVTTQQEYIKASGTCTTASVNVTFYDAATAVISTYISDMYTKTNTGVKKSCAYACEIPIEAYSYTLRYDVNHPNTYAVGVSTVTVSAINTADYNNAVAGYTITALTEQ